MNKNLLTYLSFGVAFMVVIGVFITATNYFQLGAAIITYPLIVYLAFRAFVYSSNYQIQSAMALAPSTALTARVNRQLDESIGISDKEKRQFLKLLGATSISLFLFSILNKKPISLFTKNSRGAEGLSFDNVANTDSHPAATQPTDGFRISEIDDGSTPYFGFINKQGNWFIMKQDPDTGSFRYTRGESDFPKNWLDRKKLKYDYYNKIF